jgi:aryl-alcohol dehydrogenase-like predicted oxidoreductase
LGGDFGPIDSTTAQSILAGAADSGVTFFDTADVYGAGRSEDVIGSSLQNRPRNAFTVATKVGRNSELYPNGYTRDAVRRSIEGSLKRLRTGALDLVQLHCIPTPVLREGEVFDWLREFKRTGLIKHFGASVESVEEGLLCLEQDELLSLQIIFNLFRQKPAVELLPRAKERGVGIIVRLPLASGLLSGKFSRTTTFVESDHRNYNRDGQCFNVGETFAGLPFGKGVELSDALKAMVPAGMTMAQMAMRWILDHDAVSVVIPGASSPEQAKGNAATSPLAPLPHSLHEQLREFYQANVRPHIRGPY